jgi:hypothetical protein
MKNDGAVSWLPRGKDEVAREFAQSSRERQAASDDLSTVCEERQTSVMNGWRWWNGVAGDGRPLWGELYARHARRSPNWRA